MYAHVQLSKMVELRGQLQQLNGDLAPLQEQRDALEKSSLSRSNMWMWGGLAFMSVQLGFLARLTWWEYSWDIMEPVTYFVTYSTSLVMFAYFMITKAVRASVCVRYGYLVGGGGGGCSVCENCG